eukprot:10962151-Lingulodinium_polyedra.AAC.1
MGFTAAFACLPKGLTPAESWVVAEDQLAQKAMTLALSLAARRCSSMLWHSYTWPGKLALLCSSDPATVQ